MADKIIDKAYIAFVKTKGCRLCGKLPVDAHHEAVIPGFEGGRKSYIDYQALPLCHHCHLELRHKEGFDKFWSRVKETPSEIVLKLLTEYYSKIMRERDYDDLEEYEQADSYITEIIDYLKGSKYAV